MTKLKHIPVLLASCLLLGGFTVDVSAQDRNWDRDRDVRERNRDRDDRDRGMRGRDNDDDDDRDRRARGRDRDDDDNDERNRRGRGRDRDDDRDRRWPGERWWGGDYDRGRNCYTVRRRFVDRDGDVVVRRTRVCED